MCGRFSFVTTKKKLHEQLGVQSEAPETEDLPQLYNIAPTQPAPVVTATHPQTFSWMYWGLIPEWSKTGRMTGATFNARAEELTTKPTFKKAFQRRRCLILADSFYEWPGKGKYPLRIFLKTNLLLTFLGLWERWTDGQHTIDSCTIVTCAPNLEMQSVHHRMPLIAESDEKRQQWLHGSAEEAATLLTMSPPDGLLDMYYISPLINDARRAGDVSMHQPIQWLDLFSGKAGG